ncbi:hypothetical protein ACFSTI_04835 [Rhizorhabdus histidinilytica]
MPHIAARMIEDEAHLAGLIGRLCGEAGVSQLLVIGGDAKQPRGPFAASTDLLSSPALAHPMVRRIAVGGYPEGHPWAGEALLDAKIAAIGALGVTAEVITQLCFDPVRSWPGRGSSAPGTRRCRCGSASPGRPASAHCCAMRGSAGWETRPRRSSRGGLDRTAAGGGGARSAAARSRGDSGHRRAGAGRGPPFPFGGFERTARWIGAVAEGHFRFRGSDSGFQVDPAG